jgi:hypothetical protein
MQKSKGYATGQAVMRAPNWCNSGTIGSIETAHTDATRAARFKLVHYVAARRAHA